MLGGGQVHNSAQLCNCVRCSHMAVWIAMFHQVHRSFFFEAGMVLYPLLYHKGLLALPECLMLFTSSIKAIAMCIHGDCPSDQGR